MVTGNITTDDTVGWETGPKDRGTVTLIWGCVTTIFACSWTILHLNVPALTDSAWTRILRKTKWMAITIIFPEFILSKAICDLRLALRELREFDEYLRSDENDVKWKTSFRLGPGSWEYEWSWRVEYPRYARLIYRLLVLKPPVQNLGESQDMELATLHDNEEEQEQGEGVQQGQVEEEVYSPRYSATSSGQNLEVQGSSHGSVDRVRDPTLSHKSARSGREIDSTQSIEVSRLVQKTQIWTVVHSYFAHMGGLAYIDKWEDYMRYDDDRRTHEYFVLTASKLSTRYLWDDTHPLQHLVLGRDEIEDKSKADSFVKSIAVLQIAWLVLNVIARAIKKLPITQLEIATVAFALMAILTYATNWWKPKGVSRPIRLLQSGAGRSRSHTGKDLMQSFMIRLLLPHEAEENSRKISNIKRVPNDLIWMEGQTPLFYHLLGITSLLFGSLHCIAWDFEFPTRTEQLCWRVVSLLSAILPGIALGLSVVMGYFRTNYLARKGITLLLRQLQPLESISEEWWEYLLQPRFGRWKEESQVAFTAMPKYSNTNWDAEPSQEIVERFKTSKEGAERSRTYSRFIPKLRDFHGRWQRRQSEVAGHIQFGEDWLFICKWRGELYGDYNDRGDFRGFWREYEGFVERKLGIPPENRFETSCVDTIIKACEETNAMVEKLEASLNLALKMVDALNGCGGIIYIACRLMTIVLLFTCLRAAPAGVYQVVPWTTFMPGIS